MYYHHKTKLRAVRNFLLSQLEEKQQIAKAQTATEKDHEAEFLSMEQQISLWNSHVKSAREAAWLEDKAREDAKIERYEKRFHDLKYKRLQKAQIRLEKSLEDAKSFITLDNLETEIEQLLSVRQDYNFAMDKQGNKIASGTSANTQSVQSSQVDAKAAVER